VSRVSQAHEVEAASAYYADEKLSSIGTSVTGSGTTDQIFEGAGRKSSARVGLSYKTVSLQDEKLAKDFGAASYSQTSANVSLDQGIRVGTQAGASFGITSLPTAQTTWVGLRLGEWWRQETFQTVVEARYTATTREAKEGTDTDGVLIRVPSDLTGLNLGLNMTHFTTPSTILKGGFSWTQRSDRPNAWAANGEVRQYISMTRSAVHAGFGHYENVGQIEPVTYDGQVIANTGKIEWHQRLWSKFAATGGYRLYVESEKPRAADASTKQLGTDYIYGTLRWRYGSPTWVADSDEIYGFFGRYTTNEPLTGMLVGIGGKIFF